jgi:predicted RNA-binding Zn-ribbon protein involved in translation (DUF1610 family)
MGSKREKNGFMKIEEALGIVMELARDNAINPDGDEWANEPDMKQVVRDQQTALDTVEDFLVNVVSEGRVAATGQDSGICPKCGTDLEDYGGEQTTDEGFGLPYKCSCGFKGIEWYQRTFSEHTDAACNSLEQ